MGDVLQLKTMEEREEWFLSALSEEDIPVIRMFEVIKEQAESGDMECADGWIDLLIDELAGKGAKKTAMKVLAFRAQMNGGDDSFRAACKACALRVFNDRVGKVLVDNCGFNEKIAVVECLRRLDVLSRLEDGRLCYEKTWGFGAVKRVDEFYKKVTIDFSRKSGHQMSFAYAAESLTVLDDDHLFAIQYREPGKIAEMVKERPAEVAKLALSSVGEMSAMALQECLVEHEVLADDQWKGFWDKARKGLKVDPLVEVPGKRGELIRLLDVEKAYDDAWFGVFIRERDVDNLLLMLEELIAEYDLGDLSDNGREAVLNRLRFAFKADDTSNPGRLAQALLLSESFGLDDDVLGRGKIIESFFDGKRFVKASSELPTRFLQRFIKVLSAHDEERFRGLVLDGFSVMPLGVVNAVMDYLLETGRRQDIIDSLTAVFNKRSVPPALLLWLGRRDDILTSEGTLTFYNLMLQMLFAYEGSYTGMQLKLRNQVGVLFEQAEWLKPMLAKLTELQRADILRRVKTQSGWETSARRSLMGKMIKMYPELEAVVATSSKKVEEPVRMGRYTSYRSYREKQDQLKTLVDVEIPANSKEIGIARSYGDLRENAEYETARQNQGILMKRKTELERELVQVQASDFSQYSSDTVGMGTCVTLEGESGDKKVYNVLGEWDSDEGLSIISSRSKLAEVLVGKTVGDEVDLPGVDGVYKVVEVVEVSDELKSWMAVMPEA